MNPATDRPDAMRQLLELLDSLRLRHEMPIQACVLAHVTRHALPLLAELMRF